MNIHGASESLEDLLGKEIDDCPCGKAHRIPTREALLEPGSIRQLPQLAGRWFPPGTVVCAADTNTWAVAGENAAAMLGSSGWRVVPHLVDRRGQPAHADRLSTNELADAVKGNRAGALLAVGSGTINDIAKTAATAAGCPLITVATAASMNGYPSAISALTVDGVKITEPCRPPTAIIADPQILATAPAAMTGAGFGDLLSKNASTADWNLARVLHGEYYCGFSASVAEDAVNRSTQRAGDLRENRPGGLAVLAEALLRSGISMVLAGSSAPASGGEHLISHLWDMTAHWTGRTPALHGAQTGVTTLISLRLYERLLALDAAAVRRLIESRPPVETPDAFEDRIRRTFRDIAEAVLPFARQKYLDGQGLAARRRQIHEKWEQIRQAVAAVVIPAEISRSHLAAAGAVFQTGDLGLSPEEVLFAYLHARWIRNRYTVLDLAADLGVLEKWREDVLRGM